MALKFTKPTDAEHKIKLESELLYAGWMSGMAYIGLTAKFQVQTAFVGNGSPVEITGKTKQGKKLGKIKGVMTNNSYVGVMEIPDNVKEGDWAYFEVDLSKCGVKGQADPIPVGPPVTVTNMKWSAKEARRGDIVTISADVRGVLDDTDVKLTIYEYDKDGAHDKLADLATKAKGQQISLDWKYEYFDKTHQIPTDEELKKYGQNYQAPQYFFTVKIEECEFGKKQESGLLAFKDWFEIKLLDGEGKPRGNEPYTVTFADGSTKDGTLDGDGYAKVEKVPPGKCTVTFKNLKGVSLQQ
ncbi:MAG TPA: hypothetical protein VMS71_08095 [Candidatus Acidoferrum sp.]|nr:hypothetical protein [Candidatus Acidoferrum sp.]